MHLDRTTDCPLLIVMGQSNAYGHGTALSEEEKILTPLRHVYGLPRQENQAFDLPRVVWRGYTSHGMNLGNTADHTCCLTTEFARMWETEISRGADLPDLYTIQISIGSQGVDRDDVMDGKPLNMWWPDREKVLVPGTYRTADISLYPLAVQTLRLAVQDIRAQGKRPVVIGLHWNQWETEVCVGRKAIENAPQNYRRLWQGFRDALGMEYPLFLYRPLSDVYNDPDSVRRITEFFRRAEDACENVHLLDLRQSEFWVPDHIDHGIFNPEDHVHYLPCAHKWFAQQQWEYLKTAGLV